MSKALTKRNLVLGLALMATVGLVIWVNAQNQDAAVDAVQPARRHVPSADEFPSRARPEQVAANKVMALDWTLLAGRASDDQSAGVAVDLFKSHSWYVPPPPKPAAPALPPPKPVAPAVPFAYMGKIEDTPKGTLLMLSAGGKVYTALIGETIDNKWRIDSENAGGVVFTYLPLGLPQTLSKKARPSSANPNGVKPNQTEPN